MQEIIFDIGSNDGLDSLNYALFNPEYLVYSFEANPYLIKKIKQNKKKIEKFLKTRINNLKIVNCAVSNINQKKNFYISDYDLCSSLLKYKFVKIKKIINTNVITLDKFCKDNNITSIRYLHSDTQGNDFNVLLGLKNKINIVKEGVVECIFQDKYKRYENERSLKIFKKFFKKNNLIIKNIEWNNSQLTEVNIFFIKENNSYNSLNSNVRLIKRIIDDKKFFKDKIYFFLFKLFK